MSTEKVKCPLQYLVKGRARKWQKNITRLSVASERRCLYERTTDRRRRTKQLLHLSLENRLIPES